MYLILGCIPDPHFSARLRSQLPLLSCSPLALATLSRPCKSYRNVLLKTNARSCRHMCILFCLFFIYQASRPWRGLGRYNLPRHEASYNIRSGSLPGLTRVQKGMWLFTFSSSNKSPIALCTSLLISIEPLTLSLWPWHKLWP